MKIVLLSIILFSFLPFYGQNNVELSLNINGVSTTVEVDNQKKERKIDLTATYFWYKSDKIIQTTGGYQGQLLNGYYIESYPNGQIKLKGYFKYGQQSGVWKYWDENGKLQRLETWKKNLLNGEVIYFNGESKVNIVKKYKKGKLITK